ncbi:DUF1156 domain-containing protein [Halorubrum ezzemoulense]|uniref:DUF1156 domain-containing protein n=1 Tax=Halorubrum ezzemoulense TaxID=337243 RepID=UPI002330D221|nr:DUF1156 domain-containing protein [Halorubrum ezzemoulense]MDB2284498.1 DUF1156 domain-containing protein [Halorubrum ezzemoulense]
MSQNPQQESERTELPVERGYPIERVNEIAAKEGRAKRHYRPIYTMHKWWARRLGCVFRSLSLYTLADQGDKVSVFEPGEHNQSLSDFEGGAPSIDELINEVDMRDPESLWNLYPKDVQISDKKILDPFMGGGTSIIEASRFGAECHGRDINPVAWFVTKKEVEAHKTDLEELREAFNRVKESVSKEIQKYYRTSCPNDPSHNADVMYYFWVKELDCNSCGEKVSLFNDYRVGKGRYDHKGKYHVLCPDCESICLSDDWRSRTTCGSCGNEFDPSEGNVQAGYACQECGQKYDIIDAVQEQDGFDLRLYALEYHCPHCEDDKRYDKNDTKGYLSADDEDLELFEKASKEWESSDLEDYIPNTDIPLGILTDSTEFSGSIGGGHNVLRHGYTEWTDMFNDRQLLCLSKLLKEIEQIEAQNLKEYLFLAFSDSLRTNNMMTGYQYSSNKSNHIFKSNSFDPPQQPVEGNVWGAEYGMGTFQSIWEMVEKGVEYAHHPTERYIEDGETKETPEFQHSVGENTEIQCASALEIDEQDEYDAVITDPPYYDNVIYSEISEFFYAWQRVLLSDEYDHFSSEHTPRAESIVANPAQGKGAEEFEDEIRTAFNEMHQALKQDGVLAFSYHHSDSESWGEVLEALCDVGFEVTATYPITADIQKFNRGEAVSFDIMIVARPAGERTPTSWKALRREIYRTARQTRSVLSENRELSRGDIGVMEMGECFQEYSKHHGKVNQEGEIMSAKEVVDEIYGIIQEASDIGVEDVFIDLIDTDSVSYDDLNKLCRGTNATPKDLKEMRLYNQDDGFELGTWDNEKRQAYIQERVNGDNDDRLSNLDKLQFLRYRYEKGQAVQNYVDKWGVDDDLRELAGRLADVTDDDTYTRVLGDRDITSY